MTTWNTNFEAFDTDFDALNELLEMSVKDAVEKEQISFFEASEAETAELIALAEAVKSMDFDLFESLMDTANFNPLSETAMDLKIEAYSIL